MREHLQASFREVRETNSFCERKSIVVVKNPNAVFNKSYNIQEILKSKFLAK